MKFAYVTFEDDGRDPDLDRDLICNAVAARGFEMAATIWDDPAVEWSSFDLVVVRSPWDYVEKYHAFRQWLIDVDNASTLLNPRMVIEPNLVKTYLRDLEAVGISIVPTQWIADIEQLTSANDIVVKPVISAGARDTIRTSDFDVARAHAQSILDSGRMAMVQPYLSDVDGIGEISVICIDGQPQWAVKKIPALTQGGHGGGREQVPLTGELEAFARSAIAAFPGGVQALYARVDLVPTSAGLRLMELELAEPSLFIPLGPDNAADLVAQAIIGRAVAQ